LEDSDDQNSNVDDEEKWLALGLQKDKGSAEHVINVVGVSPNATVSSLCAPFAGRQIAPAHIKMAAEDEGWPLDMSGAWRLFLD
jgi:hypothetical protein